MKRYSLAKSKRLVSNSQFKMVLSGGLRLSNGLLTLYMAKNDCSYRRLGVSVPKSCGNAVIRNRAKRLLRETFRLTQYKIPDGFDYVLMIGPGTVTKDSGPDIKDIIKRLNLEQVVGSFLALVSKLSEKTGKRR